MDTVDFSQVQDFIKKKTTSWKLMNTLPTSEQDCLIAGTMTAQQEIEYMDQWMMDERKRGDFFARLFSGNENDSDNGKVKDTADPRKMILYGKNAQDKSPWAKRRELIRVYGFEETEITIYAGGLFEWMLLQEIYGPSLFPTTIVEKDLLRFSK
jgi:hypothetical protein